MVIVLCHSRHCFVWPMQSQKLEDVVAWLEPAWAFFGDIPRYLVIYNFPAAVVDPDPLHPRLTRGFLEYAQRRGFIADPAPGAPPQRQAQGRAGSALRPEALLQGRRFRRVAPHPGRSAAVVPGGGWAANPWHHPAASPWWYSKTRSAMP